MVDGEVFVASVRDVADVGGARLFVVVRLRAEVEDEGDQDAGQAQAGPDAEGLLHGGADITLFARVVLH